MADSVTATVGTWRDTLITFAITYGFQVVGALIILVIGLLIAHTVGRMMMEWLMKRKLEPPVRVLIVRLARLTIMAMTLLVVLQQVGVEVLPLIMGLGVVGVGVGFAMQGVLGNLVGGLTIIFTKPFVVGEYIELLGVEGEVTVIEFFSTTLLHADRSRVVIPNRRIVGEILHNYGEVRQLDLTVGVAYASDLPRVLAVVRQVLAANPRVLQELTPVVGVGELSDSSINVKVKPWVKVPDFNPAKAEVYQAIVERFRAEKIEIPYPHQVTVRVRNQEDRRVA